MDAQGVAARVIRLRKLRGLTQDALAQSANISVSSVRKVEQGARPATAAFVAGVARALGTTPGWLFGTEGDDGTDEHPYGEYAGIAELRTALDAYDDPQPEGELAPLADIKLRLSEVDRQVYRLRYGDAAVVLAALLHHLYMLADRPDPEGGHARAALHDAYRLAATVAGRFRQADLAAIASERHIQLAPLTDDPQRIAISAFHRSTRQLRNGDYAVGLRVLDRAREHLTDTPVGRAVGVQLDLRAGILAARAGDLAASDDWIQRARAVVESGEANGGIPAEPYYGLDASPVNVLVHWCAAPVGIGDGTEAVHRAGQVHVADSQRPERVAHHHIDMGRAWVLHGDRDRALASLNVAKRIDPHNTRRHPAVRETVLAIAEADRRATDTLAGFAHWAGIKL